MRSLPHVPCWQPIKGTVYLHVLNRQRWAAGSYCLSLTLCAQWWLSTFQTSHCHRSTLVCRWGHHASEVQQLFSTHSLSDVSWGKSVVWRSDAILQGCRLWIRLVPNWCTRGEETINILSDLMSAHQLAKMWWLVMMMSIQQKYTILLTNQQHIFYQLASSYDITQTGNTNCRISPWLT
jgi:hypothetical protein